MTSIEELINEMELEQPHEHEWWVFSTCLGDCTIMCGCNCGAFGVVREHTIEEWQLAFYAPSNPFRWADNSRVEFVKMMSGGNDG